MAQRIYQSEESQLKNSKSSDKLYSNIATFVLGFISFYLGIRMISVDPNMVAQVMNIFYSMVHTVDLFADFVTHNPLAALTTIFGLLLLRLSIK